MNWYQLLRLMGCRIPLRIVLARHYQKDSNDLMDKCIVGLNPWDSNNRNYKLNNFLFLSFLRLLKVDTCLEDKLIHFDHFHPTNNTFRAGK